MAKPNLAFKRTPNGRPRNGIMFILAFARPAVWRRLTLRVCRAWHESRRVQVPAPGISRAEG
jgi:hypothetical protein